MELKASPDAYLTLIERESDTLSAMISEYRSGKHPHAPWKIVPFARLERIWNDAAREGFVRDEKGLAKIEEVFVENVVRLAVNCRISGHTEASPHDGLDEYLEPDEYEAFVEWAIETDRGWRISDYGMGPLFDLAALVTETADPVAKLAVLDRMLNVAHQRSDLASWFVEGGSKALSYLSEGVRPAEEAAPAPAA